jgi:hypothetical protein
MGHSVFNTFVAISATFLLLRQMNSLLEYEWHKCGREEPYAQLPQERFIGSDAGWTCILVRGVERRRRERERQAALAERQRLLAELRGRIDPSLLSEA